MNARKRVIALICTVLLLTLFVGYNGLAISEEKEQLNWADFATEEVQSKGTFQSIEATNLPSLQLWIPNEMVSVDTSFMNGPFKPVALYGTADQAKSVILFVSEVSTLDEYAALMEREGGGSNFRHIIINGVECISYDVEKDNIKSLIYPVSEHVVLSVNCMPMNGDDNWEVAKNTILSSIQPVE